MVRYTKPGLPRVFIEECGNWKVKERAGQILKWVVESGTESVCETRLYRN